MVVLENICKKLVLLDTDEQDYFLSNIVDVCALLEGMGRSSCLGKFVT